LGRNRLITHKPYINFENNTIYFLGKLCTNHCPSKKNSFWYNKNINATLLEDPSLNSHDTFEDDNDFSFLNNDDIIEEEICAADLSTELTDSLSKCKFNNILTKYYHDEIEVFDKKKAKILPPHKPFDMEIKLIPGAQLYFGLIYSLTFTETEELKKYLKENLEKGFIQKFNSPALAPIIFVKKHDGSLRLCVNYRRLNANAIRDSYSIPKINDLIESFSGAKIFSRLDLRSA